MFTHRPECFGLHWVWRVRLPALRNNSRALAVCKNSFESTAGNRPQLLQFTNELPGGRRALSAAVSGVTVGPSPLWLQTLLLGRGCGR